MEEEEVVHIKVFDKIKGDVVFMGKVSTNVRPDELVYWKCFLDRGLGFIRNKATNERVDSLKEVHKVDLVATSGRDKSFSGVLYVGVDGVLRKSKSVLLYDRMTMLSVWELSHEECEKAFKCETLEVLEIYNAKMRQIPSEIEKMKKLKRLRFFGLKNLKSIPEEVGQLSSLKELDFVECGIEALPKSLNDLKLLRAIILENLSNLQLCPEDVVLFSKLKQLKIRVHSKSFTPSFAKAFWEMIKETVDLSSLGLDWHNQNQEMTDVALKDNGSILDGGWNPKYKEVFQRNKANHERANACVVHLLAIRRYRDGLNCVPKDMVRVIAKMLLNTRCDVKAWTKALRK